MPFNAGAWERKAINTRKQYMKTFITFLFCTLFTTTLYAGDCHEFFVNRLVLPEIYYAVGADVRQEAVIRKVVRDELRLALSATPQTRQPRKVSLLTEKCARCHGGKTPKAGIFYDGSPLNCDHITGALRLLSGIDPAPKAMEKLMKSLTSNEKAQLMEEMLKLENVKEKR